MQKYRVNIYVDGFNFYFGLKSKGWKKYYWLDIVKFFEQFMNDDQILNAVYYCTASPKNPGKKERQDLFFSANKLNPKFHLVFGKYVKKEIRYKDLVIPTYEEKQTDVNIAVEMIRNVIQNKCETSIIVSADSDLIPPIALIKELAPTHKIFSYFPPDRYSVDLKQHTDANIMLQRYERRFQNAILPEFITLPNGYELKRPESWK